MSRASGPSDDRAPAGGVTPDAAVDLARRLADSRAWADRALEVHLPPADAAPASSAAPARIVAAMRYALFGAGKRLRPAVVRLVGEALGAPLAALERPAVALELVHTYSLVHDDLPCMDDDDLRRGRPTVHVAFDEATAVLVGDALLTLAFEVTGGAERDGGRLTAVLARAAGAQGMVGGQALDLTLPQDAGLEALRGMHARKTAALFGAAAEMAAVAAGAGAGAETAAREYGLALGLCFQATDDLLDVTGDAATLGKTPGKDARLERATLVTLLGVERARVEAARLADDARGAARRLAVGAGSDLLGALVDRVLTRRA
jgi:farnesyl diphosphate synthase